jgi:ribosome assembly protein YihI (activator of Der GTPase)
MIHARLNELEETIRRQNKEVLQKLKTIEKFRSWLAQIDQKAEVIPIDNTARLHNLLTSLKGDTLTEDEAGFVGEVVRRI